MPLTDAQKEWFRNYEASTGIEPLHRDEVEAGTMAFNEAAKWNIDWYENHATDAFLAISRHVPWDDCRNCGQHVCECKARDEEYGRKQAEMKGEKA